MQRWCCPYLLGRIARLYFRHKKTSTEGWFDYFNKEVNGGDTEN
ncbi:hypothetical protein [Bathymodiolus platifrons methanotrophic gill symbiont]|nr:hypothetical protein [Bathymodiolus platifrons methanotrophic gill symbiont]